MARVAAGERESEVMPPAESVAIVALIERLRAEGRA